MVVDASLHPYFCDRRSSADRSRFEKDSSQVSLQLPVQDFVILGRVGVSSSM